MNIRYRVELSQAEGCELTALLSAGGTRSAGSRGRRYCWRPIKASATRPSPRQLGWARPAYTGPSAASWKQS